jgi:hypothetical protein
MICRVGVLTLFALFTLSGAVCRPDESARDFSAILITLDTTRWGQV